MLAGRRLAHHRSTVSAMRDEVLGDEIALGDHMQIVASPVRKGLSEEFGCLARALRPIRRVGQRRVMIDKRRIEVPVDGRQVPIREQGGDEVIDDLLVTGTSHAAMLGCR